MGTTNPSMSMGLLRLVVMSWCWNFLVDFLWIPLVAHTQDLGFRNSVTAGLFAVNLGARVVPNLAATVIGLRSEFLMMLCVLAGYATSLLFPTQLWALYLMAMCSGLGFIRACLTLHPAMVFSDPAELGRAATYCGAARNLGTLSALVLPITVYNAVGWSGVCIVAVAAVLLYIGLAAVQHSLFEGQSCRPEGAADSAPSQGSETSESIPWILWLMGAAFVVLELQLNICNAAVPTALTQTFGLKITTAGHFLALTNGASMCFLAWLPSAPRWLHKSPLNILLAFFSIFAAWCSAMVATVYPLSGLGLFMPGVVTFMLAAYMAQVLMLECLTGVMEVRESKKLMGVSETVGCAFAALGGYLGEELVVYGAAAPFALQACVALVTAATLTAALGYRLVTHAAASKCAPGVSRESQKRSWLHQSLAGVHAMPSSSGSFVASEREYLRWSTGSQFGEPLLLAGAADAYADPDSGSDTDSKADPDVELGSGSHAGSATLPIVASTVLNACRARQSLGVLTQESLTTVAAESVFLKNTEVTLAPECRL